MQAVKTARFDTRWTEEEKEYFEKASQLGGFRSLSEFVFSTIKEKAKKIIEEQNKILVSKRDQEIFFDAMINPPKPNEKLQKAALRYKEIFE